MSRILSKSTTRAKGRLEAFSDGVFAIAITLLVLEIVIRHVSRQPSPRRAVRERPEYLAYFIAFMTIGIAWIEHSALTEALDHVDAGFQRLNLLFLLLVGFRRSPTKIMAEYMSLIDTEHGGERVSVVFFGVVLLLMSLMLVVLGRYAEHEGLFGDDAAEERTEENRVRYQLGPSLVFYAVAIVCGLLVPYLALTMYVLIGVFLILPVRTLRRWLKRGS